jgi:hypothetical protein
MNEESTLDDEFPYLNTLKEPTWKLEHEHDLKQAYRFREILQYIVGNRCRLEHREHTDSDHWKSGTIREFIEFATSLPYKQDPKQSGFQDYLKFWRIKRSATRTELERIITIDEKEEL